MFLDLTLDICKYSHILEWANSQNNKHIAMGHIGTHLDVYERSNISLDYFKSRGVLFDVRNIEEVGVDDIDLSKIMDNDFVLFRSGAMENKDYGCREYFDYNFQLSNELINVLISKKIRFIGIDSAGIRNHLEHESADRLCERNGIYVIENLCNLDKINSEKFILYTNYFNDERLTGLRCRVIAEIFV